MEGFTELPTPLCDLVISLALGLIGPCRPHEAHMFARGIALEQSLVLGHS